MNSKMIEPRITNYVNFETSINECLFGLVLKKVSFLCYVLDWA